MNRAFLLFTILLGAIPAWAGPAGAKVEVKMVSDPPFTVGDDVKLDIHVSHEESYSLIPPPEPIDLKPFEFKRLRPGPVRKSSGVVTETFTLVCTVFEPGRYEIPPVKFTLSDSAGNVVDVSSGRVAVEVVSVLKVPPAEAEMKPIKGPASIGIFAILRTILWPLILVILLSALYFYLRRKARKMAEDDDVDEQLEATAEALRALRELRRRHQNIFGAKTDEEAAREVYPFEKPHLEAGEEAMAALLELQNKKYVQDQLIKHFHLELSHIFRHYVFRRYGVPTYEKTTAEIIGLVRKRSLEEETIRWMYAILDHCDFAKFSPIDPTPTECDQAWRECWEFVIKTAPPVPDKAALPASAKTSG